MRFCRLTSFCSGRRYLRQNGSAQRRITRETASQDDLFQGLEAQGSGTSGFPQWYAKIKQELAASSGPYWLGGTQPFPYNPAFKPPVPLTEEIRDQIVAVHTSDPKSWTARRLSNTFKVSIPRVKAILKIKQAQAQMIEKGFTINPDYVEKMEQIVGAKAPSFPELTVAMKKLISEKRRPCLVAVPEGSTLSPAEAAQIIGRPLRHPPEKDTSDDSIESREHANLTIRVDQYEKSRHKFVFVDTSEGASPQDRRVLIREPTGELRLATKQERMSAGRRVWGRDIKRFIR